MMEKWSCRRSFLLPLFCLQARRWLGGHILLHQLGFFLPVTIEPRILSTGMFGLEGVALSFFAFRNSWVFWGAAVYHANISGSLVGVLVSDGTIPAA
jgi:hypothetical protein